MIAYDKGLIQENAEALYRQANTIVVIQSIAYGLLGFVVGFFGSFVVAMTGILRTEPNPLGHASFGALICAVLGWWLAQPKATALRLQAQMALCHVQMETNTNPLLRLNAISAAAPRRPAAPEPPSAAEARKASPADAFAAVEKAVLNRQSDP